MDAQERDEKRLEELGYVQELDRNWSLLHNFGMFCCALSGSQADVIRLRRVILDHCKRAIAVDQQPAKRIQSVITGITT